MLCIGAAAGANQLLIQQKLPSLMDLQRTNMPQKRHSWQHVRLHDFEEGIVWIEMILGFIRGGCHSDETPLQAQLRMELNPITGACAEQSLCCI